MADNNYRSYRSRDPVAPSSADAPEPAWGPQDDPLAELARLIGQSDPMNDVARDDGVPADGQDWTAGDRYAGPSELAEDNYDPRYEDRQERRQERRYDERHEPPRLPDPYPQYRAAPPVQTRDYGLPATAPAPRLKDTRDDAPSYAVAPPRYRDEQVPPDSIELPAFLPRSREDRYEYDDQDYAGSDPQYALEDDEEEAPSGRRRGGLVVIAAVLGLAVLGTAGAFAYRSMFGSSMLPSLPPIIRADEGPTKIMPNAGTSQTGSSDQANASGADSADKLVPRQETPVVMPQPPGAAPSTAPRVVSTIPIFPDPTPGPPSGMTPGAAPTTVAPWPVAQAGAPAAAAPVPLAQRIPANQPAAANPEMSSAPGAPTPSAVPGAKVIHTVPIRPDQMGGAATVAASPTSATPAPPPPAQPAPVPRTVAHHPVKPAPAPAPTARADANAPLSIVPSQGNAPPATPARVSPAPARPTAVASARSAAPSAAAGGYAVQVSSQRSEADAQTEFRVLQAKFPDQLGGRQPRVRRADLGDKGIYYRAMVGPFASAEQAAQMCSSLKAAGGSCIVQKD